ncbi:MAG TPA: YlxR family protein [Bacillota bacterium]
MARRRHIPQRTCIGCRQTRDKRELLRIVRTPEGEILFDPTGKRSGRGAYVCSQESCLERALVARTLAGALKVELDAQTIAALRETLRSLIGGGNSTPS